MRFLRESAIEKVLHGHDDPPRDQQGDVRRMSVFSRLARRPARGCGNRDSDPTRCPVAVAGRPRSDRGVRAMPSNRCRRRARGIVDLRRTSSTAVRWLGRSVRRSIGASARVPRRVALLLPDVAAQACLSSASSRCRSRRDDLESARALASQEVRPVPIEEACARRVAGRSRGGRKRRVRGRRRAHGQPCASTSAVRAGRHGGRARRYLSTFGVINLLLASNLGARGDWLVVHMRPEYASIAIMRRDDMLFFRNRAEGDAEALEDVVHQTAMYDQDRLEGRGFSRILLGGIGRLQGEVDLARRNLEARMGTVVEPIDPTRGAALTDRIHATPELMATLSPLVGMLLRTRREAA